MPKFLDAIAGFGVTFGTMFKKWLTEEYPEKPGPVAVQIAGVSSFQLPRLFLADWQLGFPREVGDPAPEICSAAPGDVPVADPGASLARRFAGAFGRRDIGALGEMYGEDVALYTPPNAPTAVGALTRIRPVRTRVAKRSTTSSSDA